MHRALVILIASLALAACAHREQALVGVENPERPSAEVVGVKTHEIYVMTTRQASSDPARMYSGVLPDEFEPVSAWAGWLSLIPHKDRATRPERRHGSA